MTYSEQHLKEAGEILTKLDTDAIEGMAALLARVRADGGRLFFLGVGGRVTAPMRSMTSEKSSV